MTYDRVKDYIDRFSMKPSKPLNEEQLKKVIEETKKENEEITKRA